VSEPAPQFSIQPLWLAERRTIERAIALCDGNVRDAARYLEVAPSTLYRKIQAWENLCESPRPREGALRR